MSAVKQPHIHMQLAISRKFLHLYWNIPCSKIFEWITAISENIPHLSQFRRFCYLFCLWSKDVESVLYRPIAFIGARKFGKSIHSKWHCWEKIPWHKVNAMCFARSNVNESGNTFTWHLIHSISVSSQSLIFPSALSLNTESKMLVPSLSDEWIQMSPIQCSWVSARMRRRRRRGFQSAWINTFVFKQTNCTFYYHHTVWWPFWLHCAFARLSSSFSHSQ